jgi:putative oxidoreductase
VEEREAGNGKEAVMGGDLTRGERRVSWGARIVVAAILLQTLFFKFTGAPEPVHIFSTLGMEPWGRIGSGIAELVASVLLLVPATAGVGAAIALAVIVGALGAHFGPLGIAIVVNGESDGGLLFLLAWVVLAGSLTLLWLHRRELPFVGARFR